jgi:Zn-dependent peptidase ImmA (M78 family)
MRIPASFQLLSRTISVVRASVDGDDNGLWDHTSGVITIAPDIPDDHAFHTFGHELTHAILDMASYDKLSADEAFVDRFGGLLAQALQTAVYDET